VSVIVTPATALLVIPVVAIATEGLAVTAVLAALMALACTLVSTNASYTTVLISCLVSMKGVLLL
jgi:hypothetical protein